MLQRSRRVQESGGRLHKGILIAAFNMFLHFNSLLSHIVNACDYGVWIFVVVAVGLWLQ